MKVNDPGDGLIEHLAEQLLKFDKPFLIVSDMGDHHLKVIGNTDKFESGHLNMAIALEAVAHNLRKLEDGQTMANQ